MGAPEIHTHDLRELSAEQIDQWIRWLAQKPARERKRWQRIAEAQAREAPGPNTEILDRIGRAAVTLAEDPPIGEWAIGALQDDIRAMRE